MRDIFESFDFHTQIDRLAKSGLLYLVAEKFANIDLHPATVSNAQNVEGDNPPIGIILTRPRTSCWSSTRPMA